jgi:aryl-alcohol dehydrogenase-like predicted oxidoreductase
MYGRAEQVIGDLVSERHWRPQLFMATKVWTRGRKEGVEQMQQSMRRLRVDRVDLMQVHNLVDARTHLDTLRGWKADGRVRYVGVTHYTSRGAEEVADLLATETVDFVQINYSPVERPRIAVLGVRNRLHQLGADHSQVRGFTSGGDVRHSGDEQARPRAGQSAGGHRQDARRGAPHENCRRTRRLGSKKVRKSELQRRLVNSEF